MRRVIAWILTILLLGILALGCIPSGYEGKNPARPEGYQVPKEQLSGEQPTGEQPPTASGAETGSESDSGSE